MPGTVEPVANEREGLLGYLGHQRLVLRTAAYGLTDDQARATPTPSTLSVGGLIKHAGFVERIWMNNVLQRESPSGRDAYQENFQMLPSETLPGVIDGYGQAGAETDAVIAAISDLGKPVPVPKGSPWYPDDLEGWSVRWVLLHLISETARHAGHADIIREAIDGATAFPLMAAAEGWPATPWLQPWQASED
jgi:Protein of unknown function (DUF664)